MSKKAAPSTLSIGARLQGAAKWPRLLRQTFKFTATDRKGEVVGTRQQMRAARQYADTPEPGGIIVLSHNNSRRRRQLREMERERRDTNSATGGTFGGGISVTMPGHRTRSERRTMAEGWSVGPDGETPVRVFNPREGAKLNRKINDAIRAECEAEIGRMARGMFKEQTGPRKMRDCRNVARMRFLESNRPQEIGQTVLHRFRRNAPVDA